MTVTKTWLPAYRPSDGEPKVPWPASSIPWVRASRTHVEKLEELALREPLSRYPLWYFSIEDKGADLMATIVVRAHDKFNPMNGRITPGNNRLRALSMGLVLYATLTQNGGHNVSVIAENYFNRGVLGPHLRYLEGSL